MADRILADFQHGPSSRLPSRAKLAKAYGVSHGTISRAAKILAQRGLLVVCRGRRMQFRNGATQIPVEQHESSRERVLSELRDGIAAGTYKPGHPLPKLRHFMSTLGVGAATLIASLRTLAADGLVHKHGKAWIVGRARSVRSPEAGASPYVVLMLMTKQDSWKALYAPRTASFCTSFSSEAEQASVQVIPVYADDRAPLRTGNPVVGRGRIRDTIRSLDHRFLGMLLPNALRDVPDLADWISLVVGLRRPVVWFDRYDEHLEQTFDPRYFTRCHYAESPTVDKAVDFLTAKGHRHIAFPSLADSDWHRVRGDLIAQRCADQLPDVRLTKLPCPEDVWEAQCIGGLPRSIALFERIGAIRVRESIDLFRNECPDFEKRLSLAPPHASPARLFRLLGDPEMSREQAWFGDLKTILYTPFHYRLLTEKPITAVVVPDDGWARECYLWLHAAGVHVPRQISLISFDNYIDLHPLPITTVDFGFGSLGFSAFHAIAGDIPVRKDRRGNVPAAPRIVDRGSVGAPVELRKQRLPRVPAHDWGCRQ